MHRYPTRYQLRHAPPVSYTESDTQTERSLRWPILDLAVCIFCLILAIKLFVVHEPLMNARMPPRVTPNDPLTNLFYDVSAYHLIKGINCSFTSMALQHLPNLYQTTRAIQWTPLHQATYVFMEASLMRWATQCEEMNL